MKAYKVHLEFRKKKIITVVAENEREAARAVLDSSDKFITIAELEVEADAVSYEGEEE